MKSSPKKLPHKYRIWGRSRDTEASDCQVVIVITVMGRVIISLLFWGEYCLALPKFKLPRIG